jgi:hypothetical protein
VETMLFIQQNPEIGKWDDARGFKASINGYCNAGEKLAGNILHNRPIFWHVRVSFTVMLAEDEHRQLWAKYSRKLHANRIIYLAVREPNNDGLNLHYHTCVCNAWDQQAIQNKFEISRPKGSEQLFSIRTEKPKWGTDYKGISKLVNYILKNRIAGEINGKWTGDVYWHERRLFPKECKLPKYSASSDFWIQSQKVKQDIVRAYRRERDSYKTQDIEAYAKELAYVIDDSASLFDYILKNITTIKMKRNRKIIGIKSE